MPRLRLHTIFPSKSRATRSPVANAAYTDFPSTAMVEAAQPVSSLIRISAAAAPAVVGIAVRHRSAPVAEFQQKTSRLDASAPERKTRSPQTTGELFPGRGTSAFQATFFPEAPSHSVGGSCGPAIPFPPGPRSCGQLARSSGVTAVTAVLPPRPPAAAPAAAPPATALPAAAPPGAAGSR